MMEPIVNILLRGNSITEHEYTPTP